MKKISKKDAKTKFETKKIKQNLENIKANYEYSVLINKLLEIQNNYLLILQLKNIIDTKITYKDEQPYKMNEKELNNLKGNMDKKIEQLKKELQLFNGFKQLILEIENNITKL